MPVDDNKDNPSGSTRITLAFSKFSPRRETKEILISSSPQEDCVSQKNPIPRVSATSIWQKCVFIICSRCGLQRHHDTVGIRFCFFLILPVFRPPIKRKSFLPTKSHFSGSVPFALPSLGSHFRHFSKAWKQVLRVIPRRGRRGVRRGRGRFRRRRCASRRGCGSRGGGRGGRSPSGGPPSGSGPSVRASP